MTRTVWTVCALSLLIAGSAFADAASEATAVAQAFARAANAADTATVVALYDDGATAIWTGQGDEAKGKAAIERLVKDAFGRKLHPRMKLKRVEAVPLGDKYIANVGYWDGSITTPDGKVATVPVRRSEVLVKGADGKWRYLIDHLSVGTQPPPEAQAPAQTPSPKKSAK